MARVAVGDEQRPREEGERVRDQSRARCEQPPTGVEGGLEDLLLERLVADDLRDQQIGRPGRFDVPRPAGDERDSIGHVVGGEHPRSHLGDVARLDRVDHLGPCTCRGHRQHAAACSTGSAQPLAGADPAPGRTRAPSSINTLRAFSVGARSVAPVPSRPRLSRASPSRVDRANRQEHPVATRTEIDDRPGGRIDQHATPCVEACA